MALRLLAGYLIVCNLAAWLLFGIDKRRAKKGRWRVSERTLILLALAGGSAGALVGMYFFHHKTRKKKFSIGIPLILAAQLLAAGACLRIFFFCPPA